MSSILTSVADPGSEYFPSRIPDPHPHQRIWIFWKYGSGSRFFIHPRSRIPDPGIRKAPDPGSATLILTYERKCWMEGEAEAGRQELRPLLQAVPVQFNTTWKIKTNQQCCGSRKVLGLPNPSLFVQIRIRILPSSRKTSEKNLDFYCFVTSLWLFIFDDWWLTFTQSHLMVNLGDGGV